MLTSSEFRNKKLLSLHTGESTSYNFGLERLLQSTKAVSDGTLDIAPSSLSGVMSFEELKSVSPVNVKTHLRQTHEIRPSFDSQPQAVSVERETPTDMGFQDSYNSDFREYNQTFLQEDTNKTRAKSSGGYNYTNLDSFKKMAIAAVSNQERRRDLLRDKEFRAILDNQQSSLRVDINLKNLVYTELKSDSFPGDFVVDIITLALMEMSQTSQFTSLTNLAHSQSVKDIERSMSKFLKAEDDRRQKLEAFADKVIETRKRYSL
jgi:hypothetical protein